MDQQERLKNLVDITGRLASLEAQNETNRLLRENTVGGSRSSGGGGRHRVAVQWLFTIVVLGIVGVVWILLVQLNSSSNSRQLKQDEAITPDRAKAFITNQLRHAQGICNPAIKTLVPETAEVFAKSEAGYIELMGVEYISEPSAIALAQFPSTLRIGLKAVEQPQAKALASHSGTLELEAVETLSDQAAAEFAKKTTGQLMLSNLRSVSPKAKQLLRSNQRVMLPAELRR